MKKISKKNKVFVALSGGVDSSVACLLLKERGFDVTAVFMRCWTKNSYNSISSSCTTEQDEKDARRVAARLKIKLLVFDFTKEYKKEVADYMIQGYRKGNTPNPDIICNKKIKFGLFLKKSMNMGADYIATGHYVRLRRKFPISNFQFPKKSKLLITNYQLQIAIDMNKDQSYFLWKLTQNQIKRCLFPVGDYLKSEIREIAKKHKLPTAGKGDSQGICFVGKVGIFDFLKKYIKPKIGNVIGPDGMVVGKHNGAWYYTIGQRHGFGGGGGKAYYIVKKDIRKNILYAGYSGDSRLYRKLLYVNRLNWIDNKPKFPFYCLARIRYRQPLQTVLVSKERGKTRLSFAKPQFAPAKGQSVVFYRNGTMLGGGVISRT